MKKERSLQRYYYIFCTFAIEKGKGAHLKTPLIFNTYSYDIK